MVLVQTVRVKRITHLGNLLGGRDEGGGVL
jgi:hypothetical protein